MKSELTDMIARDTCWDARAALVLSAGIGSFEVRSPGTVELHGPSIGRRNKRQYTECELHFQEVMVGFCFKVARLKICLSLLNCFLYTTSFPFHETTLNIYRPKRCNLHTVL
jgi:hypothetical protein